MKQSNSNEIALLLGKSWGGNESSENPGEENPGEAILLGKMMSIFLFFIIFWGSREFAIAIAHFHEGFRYCCDIHPPKINMTMENPPFEDVFPIEHGDFPMSC